MRYSPKPLEHYVRHDTDNEPVGVSKSTWLTDEAVWNLFYLTEPLVDVCANWPQQDIKNIPIVSEVIWACVHTCRTNPQIKAWLQTLTPTEFIAALNTTTYKTLLPYKHLGELWFEIMERRSRTPRGVITETGNVLQVNFGSAPHKSKHEKYTCDIMPLSFKQ